MSLVTLNAVTGYGFFSETLSSFYLGLLTKNHYTRQKFRVERYGCDVNFCISILWVSYNENQYGLFLFLLVFFNLFLVYCCFPW